MKKVVKAAGLSLLIMTSYAFATTTEAAQKVGYVNTAQVFQALPQREVVLQTMQKEFKEKADELKKLQSDAKSKIEKLQRDKELLSQDDIEKLRIDIAKLDSEYKVKAQAFEKATARREAEEKAKLFKVIQDAVKKVAEKEGYDIVVDIQTMQYGKPEFNISEQVIKKLK
ncbi:OmpH family outer membrane protein [Vibrio caribbeanicus]|uniref:OmpH family outer membrane protein n=1 Tax=Vibrio caribbeanicus TaxID=701175 RepID=UPI0022839481|nr:OmpH family outer membrane protein [Vibrio caribbeanicus]MCY9844474.1 OmpH family outer membrane protein [Vibrio caribbeanicus]